MKSPFWRPWLFTGGRQGVPEIRKAEPQPPETPKTGTRKIDTGKIDTGKTETKMAAGFAIVSGEGQHTGPAGPMRRWRGQAS